MHPLVRNRHLTFWKFNPIVNDKKMYSGTVSRTNPPLTPGNCFRTHPVCSPPWRDWGRFRLVSVRTIIEGELQAVTDGMGGICPWKLGIDFVAVLFLLSNL